MLAGQLAVSIRNAQLYRQLPMVGALAPLIERRERWQRLTPAQRRRWIAAAAALLLIVAVIPWPRSVAGGAQVLPAQEVPVRAAAGGIVRSVDVYSGAWVRSGQILARLDEEAGGARMAELRAAAELERNRSAQAQESRDPVARRLAQLARAEAVARAAAARVTGDQARLLSPADGYVLTPALRAQVEPTWPRARSSARSPRWTPCGSSWPSPRSTSARSAPGQPLRLKVLGFPDRQFRGRVTEVSWQGEVGQPGKPATFLVRGWVANEGLRLRSGMTGRARVDVGRATLLSRWTRGLYRAFRLSFWV